MRRVRRGLRSGTDSEYLRARGKMGPMNIAPSVSRSITDVAKVVAAAVRAAMVASKTASAV